MTEGTLAALGVALDEAIAREDQANQNNPGDLAVSAEVKAIIEKIAQARAKSLDDMRVKARAVRWCYGEELEPDPSDTTDIRVMSSLVRDLLSLDS